MKLLMATRASAGIGYLPHTLPILKRYAKKWGADFKILDDSYGVVFWRYMWFHKFLDKYARIIHIDADTIITKSCPNLFEVVPYDTIGLVFEDKGSRAKERRGRIAHIQQVWGDVNWKTGYFNAGMFVVSRPHKEIFVKRNGKVWGQDFKVFGAEQTHYGYHITEQGHKVLDLGYKFNHMSMFSERWNGSPSRFDSHIIHYAGGAHFPGKDQRSRIRLIMDDVKKLYGQIK